ncbi:hypothetical protein SM124_18815 [Bacillus sp. 31A1R]|uniref:YkoP-like domain-containing protein n=1 Tax=Robertmurraya mangrovi TaxID=3098077 RepID=A0ABU5J2Y0_9BACI|nr:hypothetical protein [Bacillus sp. 31A1R]MDZ5473774.1 hypothetical protein [Bacillus sp. 31A1R]
MRGYLLTVWSFLDPIYYLFTRLSYVSSSEQTENIFRVRLTKYKGKPVTLSDGTFINKNDTLLKIHLHNVKLLRELKDIQSEIRKGKIIYKYVLQSLPDLHQYISNHKQSSEIRALIGITSLNKGCDRLGFEIIDITHPIYKWLKWISFIPIGLLSSSTPSIKQHQPSYLFMSKQTLEKMYEKKAKKS